MSRKIIRKNYKVLPEFVAEQRFKEAHSGSV
jgi:hypothetical protein